MHQGSMKVTKPTVLIRMIYLFSFFSCDKGAGKLNIVLPQNMKDGNVFWNNKDKLTQPQQSKIETARDISFHKVLFQFLKSFKSAKERSQCDREVEEYVSEDTDGAVEIVEQPIYTPSGKPKIPDLDNVLEDMAITFFRKKNNNERLGQDKVTIHMFLFDN